MESLIVPLVDAQTRPFSAYGEFIPGQLYEVWLKVTELAVPQAIGAFLKVKKRAVQSRDIPHIQLICLFEGWKLSRAVASVLVGLSLCTLLLKC